MIWLGEVLAGETVPIRAQFHSDQAALDDPATPYARMETGAGVFADLDTPTKRDAKTGYFGVDIDTTGFAAGIRTVRIGGTVATAKENAAVYGFRVVTKRAEALNQPDNAGIGDAKTAAQAVNNRLTEGRAAKLDLALSTFDPVNTDVTVGGFAVGVQAALAAAIEAAMANDLDTTALLQAIIDKFAEAYPEVDDLTLGAMASAVIAQVERTGGMLALTKTSADEAARPEDVQVTVPAPTVDEQALATAVGPLIVVPAPAVEVTIDPPVALTDEEHTRLMSLAVLPEASLLALVDQTTVADGEVDPIGVTTFIGVRIEAWARQVDGSLKFSKSTTSDGDGEWSLLLLKGATYVLRVADGRASFPEKEVTV